MFVLSLNLQKNSVTGQCENPDFAFFKVLPSHLKHLICFITFILVTMFLFDKSFFFIACLKWFGDLEAKIGLQIMFDWKCLVLNCLISLNALDNWIRSLYECYCIGERCFLNYFITFPDFFHVDKQIMLTQFIYSSLQSFIKCF